MNMWKLKLFQKSFTKKPKKHGQQLSFVLLIFLKIIKNSL